MQIEYRHAVSYVNSRSDLHISNATMTIMILIDDQRRAEISCSKRKRMNSFCGAIEEARDNDALTSLQSNSHQHHEEIQNVTEECKTGDSSINIFAGLRNRKERDMNYLLHHAVIPHPRGIFRYSLVLDRITHRHHFGWVERKVVGLRQYP